MEFPDKLLVWRILAGAFAHGGVVVSVVYAVEVVGTGFRSKLFKCFNPCFTSTLKRIPVLGNGRCVRLV